MLSVNAASMLAMANSRLPGQNIGYLVDALELCSRADLADHTGVSIAAVGQIIRGETKEPKPSTLARMAKKFGLSMEDLVSRDLRRESWRPENHLEDSSRLDPDGLIYLPKLSIAGSAGPGTANDGDMQIVGYMAFKRSWIRDNRWEPRLLSLHDVDGNSMAHWMPHGNVCMVHRGDSVIKENPATPYENVFALNDPEGFRFKQIMPTSDGVLLVTSFNEEVDARGKRLYPDERRAWDEIDGLHIYGRCVWRGG